MLVTKLDRAFRSAMDTYNLAYLDQHNVEFITTTLPIDTSTSTGKLILGVLAAVAEFDPGENYRGVKPGSGQRCQAGAAEGQQEQEAPAAKRVFCEVCRLSMNCTTWLERRQSHPPKGWFPWSTT